jgi:hypothetical protein
MMLVGGTLVGGSSLAVAQAGSNPPSNFAPTGVPPTAPVPDPQPSEMSAPNTQQAMTMSEQDARKALEVAGYTSIRDLNPDEDGYTATATKDGRTMKLGVDLDGAIDILK